MNETDFTFIQILVLQGLHHLPLSDEACSHSQIRAQILVCNVQQEVSIHLELLQNKTNENISDTEKQIYLTDSDVSLTWKRSQ